MLGTLIGRSVDSIPDQWWWIGVIFCAVMFPTLTIKDKLTARLLQYRDEDKSTVSGGKAGRGAMHFAWGLLDFIVGVAVLLFAWLLLNTIFSLLFGYRLFGR